SAGRSPTVETAAEAATIQASRTLRARVVLFIFILLLCHRGHAGTRATKGPTAAKTTLSTRIYVYKRQLFNFDQWSSNEKWRPAMKDRSPTLQERIPTVARYTASASEGSRRTLRTAGRS